MEVDYIKSLVFNAFSQSLNNIDYSESPVDAMTS